MSVAELFRDGGLTLLGLLAAAAALGLLAGAALGYFTASTDLRWEKAKAWSEGADAMSSAIRRIWQPPTTLIAKVRNPYERNLAPAPPHVVIPTPDPDFTASWTGAPQHSESRRSPWPHLEASIFDQDAPTDAARAIELRGDD